MKRSTTGFAIAIAWPDTWCKQAGSWYEGITRLLGFNKAGYYQAGHAAIVLVNEEGLCHYFDFGRYHAPFAYGRVRSRVTDPELKIHAEADIANNHIINIREILSELVNREACHGAGDLHASYCEIQFDLAYARATYLQNISPIPYGPFVWNGTNCSRFVRSVLLAGRPGIRKSLRLALPYTLTPSPMTNVRALPDYRIVRKCESDEKNLPTINVKGVLLSPPRPAHLHNTVQWISGEGAGSWFDIREKNNVYEICRYDPNGKVEFKRNYELTNPGQFDCKKPFYFTYLSHFQRVQVSQGGVLHTFVPRKDLGIPGHYDNCIAKERMVIHA